MRPGTVSTTLGRAAVRSLVPREEPCLRRAAASRTFSTALKTGQSPRSAQLVARRCRLQHRPTSAVLRPSTRTYHSYDHPPPPGPFNETERAILSAAYRHVPQHGFTSEALALGARDAGYLDISTNLLPNGTFDLIRWHLVTRREALVPKSKELEVAGMRTGDKVFALTWERLMGNRDVLGRWQEVRQTLPDLCDEEQKH
jgi:ubiquinone biosynthesis protein COQ9